MHEHEPRGGSCHHSVQTSSVSNLSSQDRRTFLKRASLGVGALGAGLGLAGAAHELALVAQAHAQPPAEGETPIGPKWWPSRWGPEDQAGASNHVTPQKVLEARELIRSGRIYELGRIYEAGMPMFGDRVFALRIPGAPTGGALGKNQVVWHDEYLTTEIGQVGTQFDGLAHIGVAVKGPGNKDEMRFYNGITETEMAGPHGMKKLGIEHVKPIFTRGLLLDVAGFKGRMLAPSEEITVEDLAGTFRWQHVAGDQLRPGDAVFIRTGWGDLWMNDNAKYCGSEPGIGVAAARWLAQRQVCMVGADNWGVEVIPNPDPALAFPVHQELITKHGIFLQENLDLSRVAADRVYQFAYVMAPLPIKGATGSPGRPIAIV